MKICGAEVRDETKAILFPSGEKDGERSIPRLFGEGADLPVKAEPVPSLRVLIGGNGAVTQGAQLTICLIPLCPTADVNFRPGGNGKLY